MYKINTEYLVDTDLTVGDYNIGSYEYPVGYKESVNTYSSEYDKYGELDISSDYLVEEEDEEEMAKDIVELLSLQARLIEHYQTMLEGKTLDTTDKFPISSLNAQFNRLNMR